MLFQLAENYFGLPGLADRLQERHGMKYVRPKETDLLALLEAGEIDYLFVYRSVAAQHGLKFLRLPVALNLGSPAEADAYRGAAVQITGRNPDELITRVGEPIVYSVTIPRNSGNRRAAEDYVSLLLSSKGRGIMEQCGHGVIQPASTAEFDRLPAEVKMFCRRE